MSRLEVAGLCALLQKPGEPLIVPKGDDDIIFQMPVAYYSTKYRKESTKIKQKYDKTSKNVITVKNITVPADIITQAMEIDKAFSVLIPRHIETAVKIINIFIQQPSIGDLISVAVYCRERIDPVLFNYVFSVALLHRPDTKNLSLPNLLASFPGKFVEGRAFADVRASVNLLGDSAAPTVIKKNFTATNREPEQAVAYFREDMGINLHHWHWHLVYPTRGSFFVVNKDRRGELFYYMHEQVLARYNTERLCNDMDMVKSIPSLREAIKEAYFPKLTQINSNRAWPPRFADVFLSNVNRPSDRLQLNISSVEEWLSNIKQAIAEKRVMDVNGNYVSLDSFSGIDILGNLIEASDLSINRNLYGNAHNMGHVLIAFCHDPNDRYLEGFAIMGDVATAMRDPIFYRWHSTMNDLFVEHKRTLNPYTSDELGFQNISIVDLNVQTPEKSINELTTFWELNDIDISGGLDFVPKGSLPLRITYLQHADFTYNIVVRNNSENTVFGTMRIFMSPKYDKQQNVHGFDAERQLMIEMDKFIVSLSPGSNTIVRKSIDSSVTIEYDTTYRSVDKSEISSQQIASNNFCRCGWPDNMLIPKGTAAGFKMNLFAMVSNYNGDRVNQPAADICLGADSYCGLFNRKYPDARNMGYPFDRPASGNVAYLSDFLTPNMKVKEVTIKHMNVDIVKNVTGASPSVALRL